MLCQSALAGGLVGLVLGNIRLPAVLLVASSPASGAGANLGISGVAALAAAAAHVRAGRINWRLFAWMAPPSVAGALVGGYLSGAIPERALLLAIGALLLYFGLDLLRAGNVALAGSSAPTEPRRGATVLAGAVIGLLGGFVGLILGSLRMPALLRYAREPAARAAGTNLAVGVRVGGGGLIGHTPEGVDWRVLWVGSAASVPGALLGARLTGRLREEQLLRAIGAMLVVAGLATATGAASLAPLTKRHLRRHVALQRRYRVITDALAQLLSFQHRHVPRGGYPCVAFLPVARLAITDVMAT